MSPENTKATIGIKPLDDGPNGNTRRIYAVMLDVKIPGVEREWSQRIGEFSEGYETIARDFAAWFNARLDKP